VSKAKLQSIIFKVKMHYTNELLIKSVAKVTSSLAQMNDRVDVTSLNKTILEFEKQDFMFDMKENAIGDFLELTEDNEINVEKPRIDDEVGDEETQKILNEIYIEVQGELKSLNTPNHQLVNVTEEIDTLIRDVPTIETQKSEQVKEKVKIH
jgi:hypothetical protein